MTWNVLGSAVGALVCAGIVFCCIQDVRAGLRTGHVVMFFQWPRVEADRDDVPVKFWYVVSFMAFIALMFSLGVLLCLGTALGMFPLGR